MKLSIILNSVLAIGFVNAGPTFTREKHNPLRFMTYNVRYDSQRNDITVQQTLDSLPAGIPVQPSPYYGRTGERAWSERRIGVVNDILFPNVDVVGSLFYLSCFFNFLFCSTIESRKTSNWIGLYRTSRGFDSPG